MSRITENEIGEKVGPGWDSSWIRIWPQRIVSWGIDGAAFSAGGRRAGSVYAS